MNIGMMVRFSRFPCTWMGEFGTLMKAMDDFWGRKWDWRNGFVWKRGWRDGSVGMTTVGMLGVLGGHCLQLHGPGSSFCWAGNRPLLVKPLSNLLFSVHQPTPGQLAGGMTTEMLHLTRPIYLYQKGWDHWQPMRQNDLSNLKVLKVSKSNWKC